MSAESIAGIRSWRVALGFMLLIGACLSGAPAQADRFPSAAADYEYSDTRELVSTVEDAARLLEARGQDAFREFEVPGSRWHHDTSYMYVYTADGDCLFNSGQPNLVGKNLREYRDTAGRPVVLELMDIAARPEPHAAGWAFFLFQAGNVLTPVWKITYNVKVTLPDGTVVVVGSGRFSLKMERRFMTERVDEAASLVQTRGAELAFSTFIDPASRFNILGSYIFALDMKGHALVDPSFPTMPGRDLSGMTDAIDRSYVRELLSKLKHAETASILFFWRANVNDVPQRKAIYARKVEADGGPYIVGIEYLLPTPLWMK